MVWTSLGSMVHMEVKKTDEGLHTKSVIWASVKTDSSESTKAEWSSSPKDEKEGVVREGYPSGLCFFDLYLRSETRAIEATPENRLGDGEQTESRPPVAKAIKRTINRRRVITPEPGVYGEDLCFAAAA
uniref:Uncharacterized protein n=1 Tax=Steinernema glaseri TaxID=37863 RepID=A0A1I8A3V7_9BILA